MLVYKICGWIWLWISYISTGLIFSVIAEEMLIPDDPLAGLGGFIISVILIIWVILTTVLLLIQRSIEKKIPSDVSAYRAKKQNFFRVIGFVAAAVLGFWINWYY